MAHSCGNGHTGCVNPNHLRWDTRTGNLSDKLIHGTHNRGEKSPVSKLTNQEVEKIRALLSVKTQAEIALMFGVTQSNISKIKNFASRVYG